MKQCDRVYRHICDNLDQSLDSPRCREIKKHLEGCPDCRAYLASMKQTVSLYHSLPAPRPSRALHARLLRAIALSARGRTRAAKTVRPRAGRH